MSQNQNDEGGAEGAAAKESGDLKHKFERAVKGWELRDRKLGAMGAETRIPQLPGRWGGGGEWRLIPRSIVGHMQPLDLSPAAPRSPARVLPDCFSASLWHFSSLMRREVLLHCSARHPRRLALGNCGDKKGGGHKALVCRCL